MLRMLMAIMVMTLLWGCTSKEEKALIKVYEKNKTYHRLLQKTEKIQLYEDKVSKLLLTATYLTTPPGEKLHKKDEVFLVGFYVEDEELGGLDGDNFFLTLDGKKAKSIKRLDKKSKYLKNISFNAEWNQYYLLHFPYTSKKSFHLILQSKPYGKGILYFSKVAKYVLSKKGF